VAFLAVEERAANRGEEAETVVEALGRNIWR